MSMMAVLLMVVMIYSVSAAVEVSSVSTTVDVKKNSSCVVRTTVSIRLEEGQTKVEYPLPRNATSIKVNGSSTFKSTLAGERLLVDLSYVIGNKPGSYVVAIEYTLHDVVYAIGDGMLELRVPLTSKFDYPIQAMSFTVTLPGEVEHKPSFESTYHQADIGRYIEVSPTAGTTVAGRFTEAVKDREAVTMKLRVSADMFPQKAGYTGDYSFAVTGMMVCMVAAFGYWVLFLRCRIFRRIRTTEPLQGINAGEIGCVVNLQGANLHLMVMTWAKLGYIMLYLERGNKVVLRKRMDMGNERKEEEQKIFKKLFAKDLVVSTASIHYSSLALSVGAAPLGMKERIHRRSGNRKAFRILASGIGLFGGICVAIALAGGALLQGFLVLLLGALGAVSGYYVQKWGCCMMPIDRHQLVRCGLVCLVWLLLGWISGASGAVYIMVLGMLGAGLFLAMAGRRTDLGKEAIGQTMGLRHYLRTADKILVRRLQEKDPDYFFAMAPYAIALGVGTGFARRFGNIRIGPCPYLTTGKEERVTPEEWIKRLSFLLEQMAARSRTLTKERTVRTLRNMTKH